MLEHFKVFDEGSPRLLVGFTATPKRGDGEGLDAVYEEIAFSRTLPEMIMARHLSPVAGYRVETDGDAPAVHLLGRDLVAARLGNERPVRPFPVIPRAELGQALARASESAAMTSVAQ